MKQKIKVGDRVRIVREYPNGFKNSSVDGKLGTIIGIDDTSRGWPFAVKPDGWSHPTLNGVLCHEVELLEPEKQPIVVIRSDGKTTIATKKLGKRVLGRTIAVCSDDDTFDFDTGAAIAFARLTGADVNFIHKEKEQTPPKPKYYTGRVVCLESVCVWWTPGKCYAVRDGVLCDDQGCGRDRASKDFDEFFHDWWDEPGREARFAEVVER